MDATIARIRRAIDHIEANLLGPLTLDEVAAASGLSVYHLHRLFTAVFGHSIKGYIRKRRLTEAAAMLRTTDRGVLEIALEHRFQSQASFTRAFRALFGVPPARYRRGDARVWYPGLARATVGSLEHLRTGVSHEPALRMLPVEQPVHGIAGPVDLDRERTILELWAALLGRLGDAASDAVGFGVALPCHPDVPLGPEHSLVYLAGVGAHAAPLSHRAAIPPGEYAVFEHRGSIEQIGATVDYAWATWLPRSGRTKSARPDFERFRLADFATGQPAIEIWLSIDA